MIYKFRLSSPESDNFLLEMEVDGSNTFSDFHTRLQNCIGYESSQLASFFLPAQNGGKENEVSLLDSGSYRNFYHVMDKTFLFNIIDVHQYNLIYTYDFINDRSLNIELTGIVMEKNLQEPVVTLRRGVAPDQVYKESTLLPESVNRHDDELFMDFGILNDYTELYGEM